MIAMAVVSHQCVAGTSDKSVNSSMEEEDDLLSRLRYLRQTLQDCHMRVNVLDQRVEALQPAFYGNLTEENTPTQKEADENDVNDKKTQMSYDFMNGCHDEEEVMKTQELEDNAPLQSNERMGNNLCQFESVSTRSKLQGYSTENHLEHLARKHANELCDMYWSYKVDKQNDQKSSEKKQFRKAVTWGDVEYKIFSNANETCGGNDTTYLESFSTDEELKDVAENGYLDNPVLIALYRYDGSSDQICESTSLVNGDHIDENKSACNAEYYCKTQMGKTGKQEISTDNYMTASKSKGKVNSFLECSGTSVEENTDVSRRETVSQGILDNIRNPWFKKAPALEDNPDDALHSRRRKHMLIRAKKIDFDDHDTESLLNTDKHMSEESLHPDIFNMCKFEGECERVDWYKDLRETDNIIIEDVTDLEVPPEEARIKNGSEFSECVHLSDSDISVTKENENIPVVSLPDADDQDEESLSKTYIHMTGETMCDDEFNLGESEEESELEKSPTLIVQDVSSRGVNAEESDHENDSKFVGYVDCAEFYAPVIEEKENILVSKPESDIKEKLKLIGEYLDVISRSIFSLCSDSEHPSRDEDSSQHFDFHRDYPDRYRKLFSEGVSNENVKNTSSPAVRSESNKDPVLFRNNSGDVKYLVLIVIMFVLLLALMFVFYLLITVPVLVVSLRQNGSSVAF